MTELENRPEVLWRALDQLWSRHEQGRPLTDPEHEALVEANFRLGVHPDTGTGTALTLLARANRLDPTNPKHPYHIGLIYLRHGRLEMAEKWLTAASALSPTNHRIWAHVSLVQRGLDEGRSGSADYDGDHRRRAEEILTAIREGRDDLDPAAVPPLRRPGECRWPGVHDLEVEARLRSKTSERTRDALAGELAELAGSANLRRGGVAAFCVLAVQWMVYGYPPATIRRLAGELLDGDRPTARLLNLVCDLFEMDETELPIRLAQCLDEGSLPDLLVAMIHRGRLFRKPLGLPDLGAYTAAKEYAGGDPTGPITAMTAALRALSAEPPEPMADVRPAEAAPESAAGPDEKLAQLEHAATELSGLVDQVREFAKELLSVKVSTPEAFAQATGSCAVLAQLVDRIEKVRTARLEELREFKAAEPVGLVMSFDEFRARVEECEPRLQESPAKIKTILGKAERKFAKLREFESVEPVPSSRVRAIEEGVTAAEDTVSGPAVTGVPQRKPPTAAPAQPRTDGTPGEQVAAAVAAVERALADNFEEAGRTLEAYPPHLRHRQAVVMLRAFLTGHQAESDQRMGRGTAARRGWSSMLADDPLNAAAIRNLAVAHGSAGDIGSATQAWSRYLETVYQHDLLAGDPRRGAEHRAEVHQTLAGAFGTAGLVAQTTRDGDMDEDVRDVPLVLASRAKVAIATAHLRLEEVNRALSYRSPTLLLGVGRSIEEIELATARDRRLALAEAATAALPPRVHAAFTELCRQAIENAHEAATAAGGRIRRPTDEAEEEAHTVWAKKRILWKLRLSKAVVDKDADWPLTEYSGDVIGNLQLIDDLALDPLDEFIRRAAQQLGIQEDPANFLERHNQLSKLACEVALSRIYDAAELNTTLPDQFRLICRSWARNSIPDTYLEHLDDPQRLYYPSVESALGILASAQETLDEQDRRVVEAATVVLERWVARLPGASGPARVLARLLGALDRPEEAQRVLAAAEAGAFAPHGRREIAIAHVRLAIDRARYPEAVSRTRKLLQEGAAEARLRRLLTEAYNRWISTGRDLPSVGQIKEDLSPWSDDPEALQDRRILVVSATIVKHQSHLKGDLDQVLLGLKALGADLRELCADDADNTEARFQLMVVLHQHSTQVRLKMRSTSGAERRRRTEELNTINSECADNADLLLADSNLSDDARRNEIQAILKAVRR
jgi:tetratricopeptide (TPR) repeat protein